MFHPVTNVQPEIQASLNEYLSQISASIAASDLHVSLNAIITHAFIAGWNAVNEAGNYPTVNRNAPGYIERSTS